MNIILKPRSSLELAHTMGVVDDSIIDTVEEHIRTMYPSLDGDKWFKIRTVINGSSSKKLFCDEKGIYYEDPVTDILGEEIGTYKMYQWYKRPNKYTEYMGGILWKMSCLFYLTDFPNPEMREWLIEQLYDTDDVESKRQLTREIKALQEAEMYYSFLRSCPAPTHETIEFCRRSKAINKEWLDVFESALQYEQEINEWMNANESGDIFFTQSIIIGYCTKALDNIFESDYEMIQQNSYYTPTRKIYVIPEKAEPIPLFIKHLEKLCDLSPFTS